MTEVNETVKIAKQENKVNVNNGASGGVYGLAFIGALIYYIINADTFLIGVVGFFKALVWPAILIYELLEFLNM